MGEKVINAETEIIWRLRWYEEVLEVEKKYYEFCVILTLTYWNEASVEKREENIYCRDMAV